MPNIPTSKYITDPFNADDHKRTTTGRDLLKLGNVPSSTLLTIEISGTATVVVEYSEDENVFIPVATFDETSGLQFAIPASILAINVTSIGGGGDYVRVIARTIVLDNIPSQTLIIYGPSIVSSPIVSTTDHGNLSGLNDDDHVQYVLSNGSRIMTGAIDLSGISSGSASMKINATSDTPTVLFNGGGFAPSTANAGFLEILVGGNVRYIPFWV